MSKEVRDIDYPYSYGYCADTVEVSEYDTHSKLLGPDGDPLKYVERTAVGFDLSPKRK